MNSVENYIDNQNSEISLMVSAIRDIILSCADQITESIKHKIPFFSYHSNICYINVRQDLVDLGFVNGNKLSNHKGLLETKDRKSVRTISFKKISEIDQRIIKELVFEAMIIDEKKTGHNNVYKT